MELVPLSSDGRVTVIDATVPEPGPLRVALQPDGGGVGLVALGSGIARPVGRLDAVAAAAYAPVLRALRTQGRIGTCAARADPGGTLVLDLAPAAECVFANSPRDLTLLAAEHTITVTREEHQRDVLVGRGGRVAVELSPCTVAAGQDGIEVRLDGRRVGELTGPVAQRYRPMVDDAVAAGRRVGCEALLGRDHPGTQMELRLPAVDPIVETAAVVAPDRPVSDGDGDAPDLPAPAVVVTEPRVTPAATMVAPSETRRRRRPVVWAGVATVGVVVLAAAVGAGAKPDTPAAGTTSVVRPATASPASPTPSATDEPTGGSATTTARASSRVRAGGAAAAGAGVAPDRRRPTTTRTTTSTRVTSTSTTRTRSADASTSSSRDGGGSRHG